MKKLVASYLHLVDYKVADVTAASTFYIAEIYYNFNRSLMESERPKGLSALELEEFNLALEDQAAPFEEKAISVHQKNLELLTVGVYSPWIDRSIEKLAKLMPARFDKHEEQLAFIDTVNAYSYASPRFMREDASTIVVEQIDFFRYSSQKQTNTPHKNPDKADIKTVDPNNASDAIVQTAIEKPVNESPR